MTFNQYHLKILQALNESETGQNIKELSGVAYGSSGGRNMVMTRKCIFDLVKNGYIKRYGKFSPYRLLPAGVKVLKQINVKFKDHKV